MGIETGFNGERFLKGVKIRHYQKSDFWQLEANLKDLEMFGGETSVSIAIWLHFDANSILLACLSDRIIGNVFLGIQGKYGDISVFAVKKEFQIRGIGSKLMGDCEELCRKRSVGFITLGSNEESTGFYRKIGYVRTQDGVLYGEYEDTFMMEKKL